jgi:hypothetical protein
MAAKKIVFAIIVSWTQDAEETRTPGEEYLMVKTRVEEAWPGSAYSCVVAFAAPQVCCACCVVA